MPISRRNTNVLALAGLLATLHGPVMAGGDGKAPTSFPNSGPPAEELAKMISGSTRFPVDVDAKSRLESVTGKGRTLWYRYSLKSLPASIQERDELRSALSDGLEKGACTSANFVKLLEDGYTLVILYTYPEAKYEFEKVLPPRICK